MASIISRKLKNHETTYYVVYKAHTNDGYKQIWKFAGKNKEKAKRIKADLECKLINAKFNLIEYESLSFSKFVDEDFIPAKVYGKTLRENTKKMYIGACKNLTNYFQNKLLNTITTADLITFKNVRSQETGNRSVNIELLTVRQILEYAQINNYIQHNPYIPKVIGKLPEVENKRYLSEDEIKILMANASPWGRYVIFVILQTGFRHNEASNFLFSDINYDTNFIKVSAEVSKNKKERYIPISSNLKKVLLFLRDNWIDPKTNMIVVRKHCQKVYVFCNEHGNKIQSFKKTIANAVKKAGLKKTSCHTLRKSLGSKLVQAGVSLQVVSKILGHSNTQVTEKHYAFLANKNLQEAVSKLDNDSFGRYMLDGCVPDESSLSIDNQKSL